MSLSAALVLAAAAATPAQGTPPSRGAALAEARVTVQILQAAAVRQASGLQPGSDAAARPQITRRGRTILVEFQ